MNRETADAANNPIETVPAGALPPGEVSQLPPPPLEGYERDAGNAWRFIPLWPACKHRTQVIGHKPCGALSIVTRCMCAECPLFKQSITLSSCTNCESRT